MSETQQEVKHTPGPLVVLAWQTGGCSEVWRVDIPGAIATFWDIYVSPAEAVANAHLFVAAPALLKALRRLYDLITAGDLIEARGIRWWTRDSEMASIRAAIALAEAQP